jgi:hypothetical protein
MLLNQLFDKLMNVSRFFENIKSRTKMKKVGKVYVERTLCVKICHQKNKHVERTEKNRIKNLNTKK